jgi:hypothetical protein
MSSLNSYHTGWPSTPAYLLHLLTRVLKLLLMRPHLALTPPRMPSCLALPLPWAAGRYTPLVTLFFEKMQYTL